LRTAISLDLDNKVVTMQIINTGDAGAAFYLYNLLDPDFKPLKYAVETGR